MKQIFLVLFFLLGLSGCSLPIFTSNSSDQSLSPLSPPQPPSESERNTFKTTKNQDDLLLQSIEKQFSGKKEKMILEDLELLQNRYPEGYYIIAHVGPFSPKDMEKFYETSITESGSRINLLVHEMAHIGSQMCFARKKQSEQCALSSSDQQRYAFFTGSAVLIIPYDESKLHTKNVLRSYIPNLTDTDTTYLNAENGDLYGTLDELNAYTKSLRTQLAYQDLDSAEQLYFEYNNVQRQLLHLALGLTHAKNNADEWKYLTSNTSLAYITHAFVQQAKDELAKISLDSLTDSEISAQINQTQQLLSQHEAVFEEYNTAASLDTTLRNSDYTQVSGLDLEVISIP